MKLKKLEVNSLGGINPSSPIVIDFTQSKWVNVSGDNGVGKTSLLNALLVGCGQLSKDNKNLINNDSGKIDINLEFVGNDRLTYNVRCTKSLFSLTYEGTAVPEPITKMKSLLGVVGVSPMEVKNKPLKDIIKWLSTYSTKSAEEFEAQFLKLKNNIKAAQDSRASANRSLKALNEYLLSEPLFNNWEASEKKYIKPVDIKQLSVSLENAGKDSDKLLQAETKLRQLKERQTNLQEQIENLQNELDGVTNNIKVGEKFVDANKGAKKAYDTVRIQYDNAHTEAQSYNKWQEIKTKKSERDEFETFAQKADAKEKELKQHVKDLQAEILPDIKGVELITEDTHEDGKVVKEGLYWEGRNVAQMSESEWLVIVLQIWKKLKVKVVVIDNLSSLGSGAIEWLEKLNKDGAYILAAEMSREQKSLQVEYK